MFHSTFNSKAKGVAILINKIVQFSASEVKMDKNETYLIIVGSLYNVPVLLVNVYVPNVDCTGFINILLSNLPFLDTRLLAQGSDLNCVIDPLLDRLNPLTLTQSAMSKSVSEFML